MKSRDEIKRKLDAVANALLTSADTEGMSLAELVKRNDDLIELKHQYQILKWVLDEE